MKRTIIILFLAFSLLPSASYCDDVANRILINEDTEVLLRVMNEIESKHVKSGDKVEFIVEKDIKNENGIVIIEDGSPAYGIISESKKVSPVGFGGKLAISMDKTIAFNGKKIPLKGDLEQYGKNGEGGMVLSTVLGVFFPGVFGGKSAIIPAGTIFRAYVAKTTVVSGDIEETPRPITPFEGDTDIDKRLNELLLKSNS